MVGIARHLLPRDRRRGTHGGFVQSAKTSRPLARATTRQGGGAHSFTVRLTDGQRDELRDLAERAGVSRGAFARAVLLGIPRRDRHDDRRATCASLPVSLARLARSARTSTSSRTMRTSPALPAIGELQAMNFHLMQMHDALMRALGREP